MCVDSRLVRHLLYMLQAKLIPSVLPSLVALTVSCQIDMLRAVATGAM